MVLFRIKTFVFITCVKEKTAFGNLERVKKTDSFPFKMLCSDTKATDTAVMAAPIRGRWSTMEMTRWLAFHYFLPRTLLHFPKTSWEHRERKHIKDSYSCCELGSQKRTTKEYLHTHCKAFFFTLNTSHLKSFNYVQPARKTPNYLSDTNFCWLGLFSWKINYLIFMTFIYDCFTNTPVINKKNWTLYPLWIIRVQSSCTWVLPLVWGHYNRWHWLHH